MQLMLKIICFTLPMAVVACGDHSTNFTERQSSQKNSAASNDANATPNVIAADAGGGGDTNGAPGGADANGTDQANAKDSSVNASEPGSDDGTDIASSIAAGNVTPEDIESLCTAKATQMQSVTRSVSFPDPGKVCDWGMDGNNTPKDGEIRARREQVVELAIPDKAIVCDMQFRFTEQKMRYDDEIFLTFNNIVLAASMDYTPRFDKDGDYPVYDWTKVKGAKYDHGAFPTFCLGAKDGLGSCFIPPTETTGTMSLSFDGKLIRDLVSRAIKANSYELKWTTLGDNDGSDCRHQDFGFHVDISYVTP